MINKLKETATSGWFIVVVLLIISFFVLTPMISMIILGAIFAYAIRPISNILLPYLKFKTLTIILAMAIVILPLIGILILIINSIVETAPAVVGIVKSSNITNINGTTIQQYTLIQQYVPSEYHSYINSIFNYINVVLSDIARRVLNYIVETVGSVPSVAFQLFIFFASTFYFAKDANKLWKYINYAIPDENAEFFKDLFIEIEKVVKSIFFGHFLTALNNRIYGRNWVLYTWISICIVFWSTRRFFTADTDYWTMASIYCAFYLRYPHWKLFQSCNCHNIWSISKRN